MTVSRDVDQFWQQLNKRPDAKGRSHTSTTSKSRKLDANSVTPSRGRQVDHFDQTELSLALPNSQHTGSQAYQALDYESLEKRIQRPLQMLKSPVAAFRMKGLQSLKVQLSRLSKPSLHVVDHTPDSADAVA